MEICLPYLEKLASEGKDEINLVEDNKIINEQFEILEVKEKMMQQKETVELEKVMKQKKTGELKSVQNKGNSLTLKGNIKITGAFDPLYLWKIAYQLKKCES